MKKKPTKEAKKADNQPLATRDFVKEYEEFLQKWGYDINFMKFQWNDGNGHIKKFSLFEKSPTPILTTHTS
jgi:ubiquitin